MEKLNCWHCDHKWGEELKGEYPNGPCPISCPICKVQVCPECGGELCVESDCEDIRDYCGYGCNRCSWEHCGGCI